MNDTRLKQLQEMLKEDPKSSFVLFGIGQEYQQAKDFDNAISYYQQILENDPEYVGFYFHLAKCYQITGEHKSAMQTYTEGIKIAKQVKDIHALSELQNAKMNLELDL